MVYVYLLCTCVLTCNDVRLPDEWNRPEMTLINTIYNAKSHKSLLVWINAVAVVYSFYHFLIIQIVSSPSNRLQIQNMDDYFSVIKDCLTLDMSVKCAQTMLISGTYLSLTIRLSNYIDKWLGLSEQMMPHS